MAVGQDHTTLPKSCVPRSCLSQARRSGLNSKSQNLFHELLVGRIHRSSDSQAESVKADIDVATDADGRADEVALVAPGTPADNAVIRITASKPRRCIDWRVIVILVPAILNPLPDVAEHIVKPERVWLERSDGRGLLEVPSAATAIAIRVAIARVIALQFSPSDQRIRRFD